MFSHPIHSTITENTATYTPDHIADIDSLRPRSVHEDEPNFIMSLEASRHLITGLASGSAMLGGCAIAAATKNQWELSGLSGTTAVIVGFLGYAVHEHVVAARDETDIPTIDAEDKDNRLIRFLTRE